MKDGPPVGTQIKEIVGRTLSGLEWKQSFPAEADSMMIFTSPQCQACNELMPHVRDFTERLGRKADVRLFSVLEDLAMNRAYHDYAGLNKVPYVIAAEFAKQIDVSSTPYGFKLDRSGVILAKGVVNDFEQLASLWNVTEIAGREKASAHELNSKREDVLV